MHEALIWLVPCIVLLGLPLLVAAHLLRKQEKEESAPAWWHAGGGGGRMGAEARRAGSGSGKLVGGSRAAPAQKLDTCSQCGAADPAHRCKSCACAAYCSHQCQQQHWKAGHKHECKKLGKQRKAAQLAAAAPAAGGDEAAAGSASGQGSKGGAEERPEESNSRPPLPSKVLYPPERYAELAAAPPQRKQPLGLQNVGNSCYANSLLQSLLATPAFAAYLVSGEHGRGCVKPNPSDWCVLCELEKLAVQAYGGGAGGKVLSPRPLLRNVRRLGKQFSFGRQEDSHELFLRLIEAVEAVQLLEAGGKAAFDLRSRETTLIHQAFAGYTRNQVECLSCGHVSRTYECCSSLTLEVGPRVASLEAALARFAASERLDGDNKYKCDACKTLVAADKSTRLEAAPHHLQICLKRFAPGRFGKITSKLSYPEELDMAPYMAEGCLDGEPALYRLYAVVVHIDWGRSTDYGHYIAYVRCGSSWFQCDDSTVTPVAAAKALAAGAYLLFYQRQAPRRVEAAPAAAAAAAEGQAAGEAAEGPAGDAAEHFQVPAAGEAAIAAGEAAAVGEAATAEQQAVGMLRVETAPASLPHMQGAPAASAAAAEGQQQQQQEGEAAEEGIEVGLADTLHASASESDLEAARRRRLAAAGAAAAGTAAGAQQPHSQPPPGGEAAGSQASSQAEQRWQEQDAAAAAARAEVGALVAQRAQQAEEEAGSDSGASSGGPVVDPRANPYSMLGEQEDEEAEVESSSSSSSSSGGGDGGSEAAGSSDASSTAGVLGEEEGEEAEQLLAEGSGRAASASASGSDGEDAADEPGSGSEQAQPQEDEPASAEQPAAPSPAAAAVAGGGSSEQLSQAAEEQHSSPAADEQAVERLAASDAGAATSQQPAATQQPAAAKQGASAASRARSLQPAPASQPSVPQHEAALSEVAGSRVLRVLVRLPEVADPRQVDWRVQAGSSVSGRAPRQVLVLKAGEHYALSLPLPVRVAGDAGASEWLAAERRLALWWPLLG